LNSIENERLVSDMILKDVLQLCSVSTSATRLHATKNPPIERGRSDRDVNGSKSEVSRLDPETSICLPSYLHDLIVFPLKGSPGERICSTKIIPPRVSHDHTLESPPLACTHPGGICDHASNRIKGTERGVKKWRHQPGLLSGYTSDTIARTK